MRDSDLLRRDDAHANTAVAVNQTRIAIEKIARSMTWEIPGATPFPQDILPMLQEASKILARAHARVRAHSVEHVWPAKAAAVQRERTVAHG